MQNSIEKKQLVFKLILGLIFLILIGRCFQLQIFNWEKYYRESEKNRIREVRIQAPRGLMLDRHGEILVDNRPVYSISVIPYEFLKSKNAINLFANLLQQPSDYLIKKINQERVGIFTPVKIKKQINFRELSFIEEYKLDLPGLLFNTESRRFYPSKVRAPHLFGYVGEITRKELKVKKKDGYRLGDLIGKNGLELTYEDYLRGIDGIHYVEVDALGREVRDLTELEWYDPVPGKNLILSIDANLQRYLEKALLGKRGAAVVMDPRNGEILAMVSKPDYDPEIFSRPITSEIWQKLINDEGKPLYNRVSQSLYPPGSTFKLVLAMAALETGRVDPGEKFFCPGYFKLGWRNFDCWKKGGHGWVNLYEAIEQSCNVYFYNLMLKVGLDLWAKYARIFHFGKPTGIDLPNEASGLVPDKVFLDKKYGLQGWTKGLLLNMAVGQGDLLVTPLQMAYFAMILANKGVAYKPHLVQKIVDAKTNDFVLIPKVMVKMPRISRATYEKIRQGMFLVVNGEHGTARSAAIEGIEVCGKTGTAENPHGKPHAWFIGFAPKNHPVVAFCIMIENGGSGGAVAAPIARGLLSLIFKEKEYVSK